MTTWGARVSERIGCMFRTFPHIRYNFPFAECVAI